VEAQLWPCGALARANSRTLRNQLRLIGSAIELENVLAADMAGGSLTKVPRPAADGSCTGEGMLGVDFPQQANASRCTPSR